MIWFLIFTYFVPPVIFLFLNCDYKGFNWKQRIVYLFLWPLVGM